MEKQFIEEQKKKLIEQRDTILASLSIQSEDMKKLTGAGESGDEADVASDAIDRTLLDSIGAQDALRLTLNRLQVAGYKVTSISDLIHKGNYTIDRNGVQHKN